MNLPGGGSFKESPYFMMAVKLAVAIVIMLSVIGMYAFYISPTLDIQESQINEMEDAKVELHQLEGEIGALEGELAGLKIQQGVTEEALFNGSELIQMNKKINEFAAESKVRILSMQIRQKSKLEKSENAGFDDDFDMPMDDGSEMPMDDGAGMPMDDGAGMLMDDGAGAVEEDEIFTIPVEFKISGGYLDYLTFRFRLSNWEKAVNIEKETITAGQGRYKGIVTVAGTFRVVQKMKVKREF